MDGKLENMQSLTGRIKTLGIDTTLTKKGMCAEAKATGDAIASLQKQIYDTDPHYAENVIYDNTITSSKNVKGAIDVVVNTIGYATKNILKLSGSVSSSITGKGLTIKKTDENIYTLNGTTTENQWYELGFAFQEKTSEQENYFMSLDSSKNYMLSVEHEGTCTHTDIESPLILTAQCNNSDSNYQIDVINNNCVAIKNENGISRVFIKALSGVTFNDFVLKIQLEEGSEITDFEPYVEDVKTQIDNVQSSIDELKGTVGYSKKQLIPYPYTDTTQTKNGITVTDNGDGSIATNGTCTGSIYYKVQGLTTSPIKLKKGKYILNGCPIGGSKNTYNMYVSKNDSSGNALVIAYDYGEGCTFELNEDTDVGVAFSIVNGTTVNNLVFKPMIRYASIKDGTFEPYVADLKTLSVKSYTTETQTLNVGVGATGETFYNLPSGVNEVLNVTILMDGTTWCMADIRTVNTTKIHFVCRNVNPSSAIAPQIKLLVMYR